MQENLFHVAGCPNVLVSIKGPSVNEHLYVCRKGYSVHHALNRHIQSVADADYKFILEWTTRLDTSSRTLFVREGGTMSVRISTSRQTSSYVITSDCY